MKERLVFAQVAVEYLFEASHQAGQVIEMLQIAAGAGPQPLAKGERPRMLVQPEGRMLLKGHSACGGEKMTQFVLAVLTAESVQFHNRDSNRSDKSTKDLLQGGVAEVQLLGNSRL